MTPQRPDVPVTAEDVDCDFDATASPPPAAERRSLTGTDQEYGDPGHLAADDEWAAIVARAEGSQS